MITIIDVNILDLDVGSNIIATTINRSIDIMAT